MPRVRVTEEQLLQALRDLGAVSSETAVTTRKVAQHLGETTRYVRDRLDQMVLVPGSWRRRNPEVVGCLSKLSGPNYWWAIEDAS